MFDILTTGSCVDVLKRDGTRQDLYFKKWNGKGHDMIMIPHSTKDRIDPVNSLYLRKENWPRLPFASCVYR